MSMFLRDLGHCFLKHPALWYSNISLFTMDKLPYIHKSQKKYFQAFPDKISKRTDEKENTCKGLKSK